jgi:hypothetical protein
MESRKANVLLLISMFSTPTLSRVIQSTGSGGVGTALIRDKKTGDLVVVGTTYSDGFWELDSIKGSATSCFVAHGNMTDGTFERKAFNTPEMCFGDALIIDLGDLESTAVLTGTSHDKSDIVTLYGYQNPEHAYPLSAEYFPVAMSHDENDKIIMGLHEYDGRPFSEEISNVAADNLEGLLDYWDRLAAPSKITSSKVRLTKISTNTGRIHFDKHIHTNDGVSTIANMVHLKHQNRFLIAGSTNGSGEPFGAYPKSKDDWDGYVAIYDSITGELVFGGGNHRIDSQDGQDDFVHAVCAHKHDVYIVGTTKGVVTGSQQGGVFLVKMDTIEREIVWKRQFGSADQLSYDQVKCAAHHRGVFVGGSELAGDATRAVFVSRFDSDGSEMWHRTLDSSIVTNNTADDFLAGLDVSKDGSELNALLNARVLEQGKNGIILVDIDIQSGDNDLSRDEVIVIEDDFDSVLFWSLTIFALVIVSGFIVCWRRLCMREKISREHMADADYANNLKKWMDDDEIFDYDRDGLFKSKLADKNLKLKANIRGNHLRFGTTMSVASTEECAQHVGLTE